MTQKINEKNPHRNIPYCPTLRKRHLRQPNGKITEVGYFSSINSCILFQQLHYRAKKVAKIHNSFYKFVEPCNHPLYVEGDSWCEELGMTKAEFKNARLEVIAHYYSKASWQKAYSKDNLHFKNKPFASYVDKQTNLTHYFSNWPLIDAILGTIDQSLNTQVNKFTSLESEKLTFRKATKLLSGSEESVFPSISKMNTKMNYTHSANGDDDVCAFANSSASNSTHLSKSKSINPRRPSKLKKERALTHNPANDKAFDKISESWLKKAGIQNARKFFDEAVEKAGIDKLMSGAKAYLNTHLKIYPNAIEQLRYCKQLGNWLKGECWNDEISPTTEISNIRTSAAEQRKDANKRKAESEIENLMRQYNANKVNGLS